MTIIQFDPNRINAQRNGLYSANEQKKPDFRSYREPVGDFFEPEEPDSEPKERVLYSIQEVISLVGEKKTDEIFDTFLSDGKDDISGTISPPTGDIPLKESLSTIWGKNKETVENKKAKISELSKTKRAFLALEREASKKYGERTGENKQIKIVVRTEDEEEPLTDILEKQIKFYKKNKLFATADLIGQRINSRFDAFVDKMLYDD